MTRKAIVLLLLLITAVNSLSALELVTGNREFTIKTDRLEALFKDGLIIQLTDRKSGILLAKRSTRDEKRIPSGLGIIYDIKNFRACHVPWGEPTLNQSLTEKFPLVNYFRPTEKSLYKLEKISADSVRASWTGLGNGIEFLAKAKLTLTISQDQNGALTCKVTGFNPAGSIFGGLCSISNIDNSGRLIVPSFGGIVHTKAGGPDLMPFGGSPFLEAPILIAEIGKKSLSIWMEDNKFSSHYAFVARSNKSFSLALESENLMPFEPKKTFESPLMKIDVFDGDWKSAATPLRKWYRKFFKKEIAARDSLPWANKITNIIDIYMTMPKDKVLKKITKLMPAKSVLLQVWNARAAVFDRDLPDWTPRAGYIEGVKRIHDNNLKSMAYVNTYCANYMSPQWKKDKISEFFLTKKSSFWKYKISSKKNTTGSMNEMLLGTVDYVKTGEDQFKNIKKGRMLYVDPLSAKWRKYHADMMKWWNTTTSTDANYEDTAGVVGDHGNGIVNGLSAGQGSVAMMRLMQKIQPKVPMASEYGPSAIAFGIKWALNYVSMWGNNKFRLYRINHQVPLTPYIYGYRTWVPSLRGSSDMIMHSMAASSDATCGMGFIGVGTFSRPLEELVKTEYSFRGHLLLRARLFGNKELSPYFPAGRYPANTPCMYQGKDGIYQYYDDGHLQQMLGPDKKPLYGRVHGVSEVKTSLYLGGWPLQDGKRIYGLDPTSHYPLFPQAANIKKPILFISKLPAKVVLKKYYETPTFTYMELDALKEGPTEISISLKLDPKVKGLIVNGSQQSINGDTFKLKSKLPLRLTAITGDVSKAEFNKPVVKLNNVLKYKISSGLMAGKTSKLQQQQRRTWQGKTLYLNNGNEAYADFLFQVPNTKDAAIQLYVRNMAPNSIWGCDATRVKVLINGSLVKEFDCRTKKYKLIRSKVKRYLFDTQMRSWTIPLGDYAGKAVLVSVVTNQGSNSNGDKQFISIPVLIKDKEQKIKEKIIKKKVYQLIPESTNRLLDTGKSSNTALWGKFKVKKTETANVFEVTGSRSLSSRKIFPIKQGFGYTLAMQYRSAGKIPSKFYIGYVQLDKNKKKIKSIEANVVTGTDTTLAKPCKAEDMVIYVVDGSWKSGNRYRVAFNTQDDFSDLPNRNISSGRVSKIEKIKDMIKISLTKPCGIVLKAGTPVREHVSGNTYNYAFLNGKAPAKWTDRKVTFYNTAKSAISKNAFWPGTKYVKIIFLANLGQNKDAIFEFKNLSFSETEIKGSAK